MIMKSERLKSMPGIGEGLECEKKRIAMEALRSGRDNRMSFLLSGETVCKVLVRLRDLIEKKIRFCTFRDSKSPEIPDRFPVASGTYFSGGMRYCCYVMEHSHVV